RSRMCSSRSPAGISRNAKMGSRKYWPLWHLTISRMRVFYREPAAVFWVYGFPLIMALSLGTAFRDNPNEQIAVDLVEGSGFRGQDSGSDNNHPAFAEVHQKLAADSKFKITVLPSEPWANRLQAGKTDLVIEFESKNGRFQVWDEPHRTESRAA